MVALPLTDATVFSIVESIGHRHRQRLSICGWGANRQSAVVRFGARVGCRPAAAGTERENPMARLTRRQAEILTFIQEQMDAEGDAPTVREIADHFGFNSTNAVVDHLKALERKGVIEREARSARGIHLPEERVEAVRVPVLGQIAAGLPILAEENREDWLVLGEEYAGRGELFALRVRGDSMVDAHILPGDLVIVRMQNTAERGQVVAALIGDDATLKTYLPQGKTVLLLPANEKYDPIVFDKDSPEPLQILGVAIGLVRQDISSASLN
jgi:repressor LexA